LKARHDKLQERKLQVESMISDRCVELASPEIVQSYANEMRNFLELSEFTEKKAFLRSFIEKIKIMKDDGIVYFKAPINGLLEARISVLPIVQYGGR
jgi:site-specific DNA recombinase